ncbi:MAG: hypothetical protein WDA68_05575 [Phycisphaerae bacterium]
MKRKKKKPHSNQLAKRIKSDSRNRVADMVAPGLGVKWDGVVSATVRQR